MDGSDWLLDNSTLFVRLHLSSSLARSVALEYYRRREVQRSISHLLGDVRTDGDGSSFLPND